MSETRVYPTIREAIHGTATGGNLPMKAIAADLDWSPSELSMRTTMGGDSARAFPLDDEHAVRIQQVTKDHSIFFTMAEKLGYETPRLKVRDIPRMVAEARATVTEAVRKLQQLSFEIDGHGQGQGKGRGR